MRIIKPGAFFPGCPGKGKGLKFSHSVTDFLKESERAWLPDLSQSPDCITVQLPECIAVGWPPNVHTVASPSP